MIRISVTLNLLFGYNKTTYRIVRLFEVLLTASIVPWCCPDLLILLTTYAPVRQGESAPAAHSYRLVVTVY